jgi:outer membrane protein insertion porin family
VSRGKNAGVRHARRFADVLLLGTAMAALCSQAYAQEGAPTLQDTGPSLSAPGAQATAPAADVRADAATGVVRSITVRGSERIEPATVRSYIDLEPGQPYDRERLDRALAALYETELFADVTIRDESGSIIIEVRENPVINRIVLEGNRRLKEDKIREEIRLAPRQIFTRSKVSADVSRIVELYRRSGRFAASVDPKVVQLDQNRVDLIFEIEEGPKSKVRQINIIGNERFSDGELRSEMATKQSRWFRLFTSNDTYDPDRLAYDQQKLRQFYLTNGYADFRVISAVAELTPDRRDFIVTYVVEEGERYKFGDVDLESRIRDIKEEDFGRLIRMKKGDWYNAKQIEDTVDSLTETAGLLGYAFVDVRPNFNRDKEKLEMSVSFIINEAPRVYVERVDINGNTRTRDKVIRREFRLAEGDAFNSFKVKRSRDRIQSLGYFQDNLEIEQKPGSAPDKVVLETNLEEKPTGELQVSAGFSSLERFIVSLSIRERNFLGKGQELRAGVNWSSYSQSIDLGFTEPYFLGRNLALGFDVFRRDYDSFRFTGNNDRDTTYENTTTGFQVRAGFPITEYWAAALRYGLSEDDISLDEDLFYTNGLCDPLKAGRYLCDAVGKRTTSSIGYSIIFDNLNNRQRPSAGHRFVFQQDVAGVGGGVKYLKNQVTADKYWAIGGSSWIFSIGGNAGYIFPLGGDEIRLTDRFFLGEPRMRGFDIRGLGPRVIRAPKDENGNLLLDDRNVIDDALGGEIYYLGHIELEIPLGTGARELGLRPSAFVDVGAVWKVDRPELIETEEFRELFLGDSPSPRVSAGIGVSWNSPFGPFRIDVAKALVKEQGDDTQLFQFNVGTQF